MGTNTAHLEPPPIPLINETSTGKSDGYYVKLKLCRYHTSGTLDSYEFRMSLFDRGKTEDFILFIQNFQMTLSATETLETELGVQYLRTLVRGGGGGVSLTYCILTWKIRTYP